MTDSEIRKLAQEYAERFDAESSGDTVDEYAEIAAITVYPAIAHSLRPGSSHGLANDRKDFRNLVKSAVREMEKSGVRKV